jgi:hypothetical protein
MFAPRGAAQQLTPAWIEVGDGGAPLARVVMASPNSCPQIKIDGADVPMTERTPVPPSFRPACQVEIPAAAKSVRLGSQLLVLPKPNPSHIVVLGDTGCRIKGKQAQDCDDLDKWPFEQVAENAAEEKASLVVHVGDYLYRESKCPEDSQADCGGSPSGDNWEAWNADFFSPAAKLLSAAPWAFTRGNHESCDRSWRGWFYYLDPRPWTGQCQRYSAPYVIRLGSFELAMLDSSEVNEDVAEEKQVAAYAAELASLHVQNAWLVDHHPFWGFKVGASGKPLATVSAPLQEAWERARPPGISLILSGHVHLFELVNFDRSRPTQIVAGDGGTELAAPLQVPIQGAQVHGRAVVAGEMQHQFGYTVLNRAGNGWNLALKNRLEHVLLTCSISASRAVCQPPVLSQK